MIRMPFMLIKPTAARLTIRTANTTRNLRLMLTFLRKP